MEKQTYIQLCCVCNTKRAGDNESSGKDTAVSPVLRFRQHVVSLLQQNLLSHLNHYADPYQGEEGMHV